MKRLAILLITVALTFSCNKNTEDPTQIKKQISKYKAKIAQYEQKIKQLEAKLNENQLKLIPVNVLTVEPIDYQHYLEVNGTVEPIEYAYVSAKSNGEVKAIYVKEGDFVQKGQLLLELDDQLIKANIAQLEVQLALADSMYRKQKVLYEKGVSSEVQYLQAKSQKEALEKNLQVLKTQLKYTKVYAPFSGIVDQINIKVGEIAAPGARLIYLVNMDKMKAVAYLSETYLPFIEVGDKVELRFPVYKDLTISSAISYVGNFIDPISRTFKVEAKFTNPGHKVKPNMLVVIKFADFKVDKAIVLPTKYLSKDANGWYVYVVSKVDTLWMATKRYLTLGQQNVDKVVVLAGLEPGEMVVTDGYNLVRDGSFVKIVARD